MTHKATALAKPLPTFAPKVVVEYSIPSTRVPFFHSPYSIVSATIAKMVPVRVAEPTPLISEHTKSQVALVGLMTIRSWPARLKKVPTRATFRFPYFRLSGTQNGIRIRTGMIETDEINPAMFSFIRIYFA